ncbi:hypothetical protein H4R33_000176 [Dimargaris cristalligena]|nr:hypothetical protein H4R33_000176 [Dimargaris cristalligena]
MLLLRHNYLSSEDIITVEKTKLTYLVKKWPTVKLNFDAWVYSTPELYGIILAIFEHMDVMTTLNITDSQVLDFVLDVAAGYQTVPYHSFYHSVDVVVKLYYVLTTLCGERYLTSYDVAALLIAGLCHDIGHPGFNNLYQKHANTDLAQKYGDASILEKHSCHETRRLLDKHQLLVHLQPTISPVGLNRNYSPVTADTLTNSITEMILMTDMAVHYRVVEQCNQLVELVTSALEASESSSDDDAAPPSPGAQGGARDGVANLSTPISRASSVDSLGTPVNFNAEQRLFFCNVTLHAVDIFNPVLPWDMCKRWSDVMIQESFRQGDLEKLHNFPITPSMDRTQTEQCQISLDFAHYIVKPFFESLAYLFPVDGFVIDSLNDNIRHWEKLREETRVPAVLATSTNDEELTSAPTTQIRTGNRVAHSCVSGSLHGRRLSVAAGTIVIAMQHDPWRRHSGDFFSHKRSFPTQWQRKLAQHKNKRRQVRHLNQMTIEPGIYAFDQAHATCPLERSPGSLDSSDTGEGRIGMMPPAPGSAAELSNPPELSYNCNGATDHYHAARDDPELNRQAILHAISRSRQNSTQLDHLNHSVDRLRTEEVSRKYRRSSSLDVSFLLRSPEEQAFPPPATTRTCRDPTNNVNVA